MALGLGTRFRTMRRRSDGSSATGHGLEIILSEIRRARRFNLQFTVALFHLPRFPRSMELEDIARRFQAELREFDYVVVDDTREFIALWMFGTPRDGAHTKVAKLRSQADLSDLLADSAAGVATFPGDGMTYEALVDSALGEAHATIARLERESGAQIGEGVLKWQPNIPPVNITSSF